MLTIRFGHSHIYPGARARANAALAGAGETLCLVEFADGAQVPARLAGGRDALRLGVEAYTTARGTSIPAKRWLLVACADDDGGLTLRVTSRAPETS